MADDLDDDWFVKENILAEDENEENGIEKIKKKAKAGKKRKAEDQENEEGVTVLSTNEVKSKKKKKKKKKKVGQNEEETILNSAESFWSYAANEMKSEQLTDLELLEIKPDDDDWFLEVNDVEIGNEKNTSSYLKNVIPNWESLVDAHTMKEKKASPLLLIITSGGQRAVDVLRDTKEFRGEKCKCTKLFAKHFKVAEQIKYLSTNIVHLGVGTPNRILKLIEEDGLKLKHVKYVVVDWTWRDVKTRKISNMPGVKEDLIKIFEKYLFKRCKMKKLKVGLL